MTQSRAAWSLKTLAFPCRAQGPRGHGAGSGRGSGAAGLLGDGVEPEDRATPHACPQAPRCPGLGPSRDLPSQGVCWIPGDAEAKMGGHQAPRSAGLSKPALVLSASPTGLSCVRGHSASAKRSPAPPLGA